jgi:hypothetical protein
MMTTPFFALFGWTWFYLSALMGLFTITNYIFSVTLRMIGLWKERGFGWWLLGGLPAATYNLHLLPTTVIKNIKGASRESSPDSGWDGAEYGQPIGSPAIARRNRIQSRREEEANRKKDLQGR